MSPAYRAMVCTVESDSHIWNLVYLQKLLEEYGMRVRNLGCCTPVTDVVAAVAGRRPDLLVVSSVNGHGHHGARLLLSALRRDGLDVTVVVGGKLTTAESDNAHVRVDLLAHGCAEVFTGEDAVPRFREFLCASLPVSSSDAPDIIETGVESCTL
jgi:methylaspartate mutase sigma subunit